ncbi:prolipoprotein diacylglyceryl transferase [Halobacillus andaensis]|uniref:Phosphatidylglycerol--prolipoprotein diacylglyceryl transferase n=1 Tax=Halobacillus andaensis TaxID=1176239 RepID=A0A917B987_HALAA|nr:prolipoprotein diacylglyceryl transferase [Halobacillus andaensis]MBP2005450.1 phosphatidylglycerol:prolipoprotein diacylglycerol transferase [Halobacillus andaensis]GGF31575.1 prolipoprotein diacylglyceryl transferase [Halobacillus andaensis]
MACTPESLDRVLIQLGPLSIYWYGVIIATGAFLGLLIATRETERLGLKKDYMVDIVVYAIPIAILCARLYYVIFEWDRYVGEPWWKAFAIWEGGIAIHGALIGSFLTAYFYTKLKGLSFWMIADIAAPSIILGQAIGRWGNFMNQEAHGGPVSESFYNNYMQYLPNFINQQMCIDGTVYHPTFLYESLWNILGFILLLVLRHKFNPRRGEVFLSYIIWYSIGRFYVEGLRTDSLYLFGEIRTAQFISILLIVLAVAVMIYRRKVGLANKYYNGKKVK